MTEEGEEDLDALFGAFDGEDDAADTEADRAGGDDAPAEVERGDESEDDDADARADGEDAEEGGEADGDGDGRVAPTATERQTKASYADVMSSSRGPADEEEKNEEGEGGKTAAATASVDPDKEVSTGTSHDKSVRSYSAVPDDVKAKGDDDKMAEERPPAKTYPFELDPFQKQAVGYVEAGESVLVAAHTSAGKTAVAEYAIAKSLRDGQRVVYTSPIKALSNQKFRDLSEEFEDVGLMTGDITINPEAACLVMTTEILRSMLYRGSEVMREVAWVIFDEVHYMRDKERGVVWEESIVLLPHRVRFVFLSATIPNAEQFVDWIAKIHHQPCHVVYTNYRPVPLQHYIFPKGGDGLHLVVDERGKFREANFQKAMAQLQSGSNADAASAEVMLSSGAGGKAGQKRKRKSGGGAGGPGQDKKNQKSDLHRIVKLVMERNLNPVIVFSFSKKDCERYALDLQREDYTDEVEKDLVSQVYKNAIDGLSEDDRKLPQVEALLPLLKKGVGIHHGGLLPILKEIVEILFSEGLIKVLFATETFSIGINMPAKTVVFTNTRKWDGTDFRWVTSGEYIQMSGRAGRRGKDDRGIVIQMLDEKMEPAVCKGILYGDPDPLNSSYRISYNMLLNMMRVEDVDPEYLLRASFHQFQQESEVPALEAQADELERRAAGMTVGGGEEDEEAAGEYFRMQRQMDINREGMARIVRRPEHVLPFVQNPGRLLHVSIDGISYGWGALVSYKRRTGTDSGGSAGRVARDSSAPMHTLDVLLACVDRHFDEIGNGDGQDGGKRAEDASHQGLLWRGTAKHCRPTRKGDDDKLVSMRIFTVDLDDIERISAVRIFVKKDLHPPEARHHVFHAVREVQRRFPEGVPLLDPVKDLKIRSEEFGRLLERAASLKDRLESHRFAEMAGGKEQEGDMTWDEREAMVRAYGKKSDLLERARVLRRDARSRKTVVLRDDLRKMKRVLRHLGHVDAGGVIQTKGRAACEVNTANELLVVELLFAGVFNDLKVGQAAALLSCLTFDEVNKEGDDAVKGLKGYLANPFYKLQECSRTVARASIQCKIDVDEQEEVDRLNPGM